MDDAQKSTEGGIAAAISGLEKARGISRESKESQSEIAEFGRESDLMLSMHRRSNHVDSEVEFPGNCRSLMQSSEWNR